MDSLVSDSMIHFVSRKTRRIRDQLSRSERTCLDGIAPADAFFSDASNLLLHGDAVARLKLLPSGFIHTCLTSPPYWQARDYGQHQQIGNEEAPETYIERIVETFSEVKRVLRDDGTAWLNLGDTYLNGIGTVAGRPPAKGWKRNKQLSLMPFRVAMALQDDGWWVRNTVAWHKPNAMPESMDDRFSNAWEPVFLLTKNERYYFNLDTVRVPHRTDDLVERKRAERGLATGKAKGQAELRRVLSSPRHRATIDGLKEIRIRPHAPHSTELAAYLRTALAALGKDIKWVAAELNEPFERVRHYFRTDEIGSRLPPEETWPRLKCLLRLDAQYDTAMSVVVTDNIFRNHPKGRNPGDLLSIPTARTSAEHFATMPNALVERCLLATLPKDGICLDPFMGLGTTGQVALALGGRFVGIDLHEPYIRHFREKMKLKRPLVAG
jgi:DNA modification methylase